VGFRSFATRQQLLPLPSRTAAAIPTTVASLHLPPPLSTRSLSPHSAHAAPYAAEAPHVAASFRSTATPPRVPQPTTADQLASPAAGSARCPPLPYVCHYAPAKMRPGSVVMPTTFPATSRKLRTFAKAVNGQLALRSSSTQFTIPTRSPGTLGLRQGKS
jgi:hypothetical protein